MNLWLDYIFGRMDMQKQARDYPFSGSKCSPFRIEGKEAIRNFFSDLFQLYPKRRVFIRQPSARAFGDDLVIQNGYSVLQLTAANGDTSSYNTRYSLVWAKIDGRWQILDQHVSRLPSAQ